MHNNTGYNRYRPGLGDDPGQRVSVSQDGLYTQQQYQASPHCFSNAHPQMYQSPQQQQQQQQRMKQSQQQSSVCSADGEFRYLQDLLQGDNEWLNIQAVIRSTFRMMNNTIMKQHYQIKSQTDEIQKLQHTMKTVQEMLVDKIGEDRLKGSMLDFDKKIQRCQETNETLLTQVETRIYQQIDQKVDMDTLESELDKKVDAVDLYNSLKSKANAADIATRLEEKVGFTEMGQAISRSKEELTHDIQQDMNDRLAQMEKKHARRQDVELHFKSLREDVDGKADRDEMVSTLDGKAEKADCTRLTSSLQSLTKEVSDIQQQSDRVNKAVDSLEIDLVSRTRQHQEQMAGLESNIQRLNESISTNDYSYMSRLTNIDKRLDSVTLDSTDKLRALECNQSRAISQLNERQTELLHNLSQKVENDSGSVRSYLLSQMDEVREAINTKLEPHEVQQILEHKLEVLVNDIKENTEHAISHQQTEFNKSTTKIRDQLDKITTVVNLKANKGDIEREMQREMNDLENRIEENARELSQTSDGIMNQVRDLMEHLNTVDACATTNKSAIAKLQAEKVDAGTYNQWVKQHKEEINSEFERKCNISSLEQLQQTASMNQAAINEQINRLDRELSEQRIIKTKLDDFLQHMSEHYIDQPQLEESSQRLMTMLEKQHTSTVQAQNELKNNSERLHRLLADKVDHGEFKREIIQLDNGKVSRKEFDAKKKSDSDNHVDLAERLQHALSLRRELKEFKDTLRRDVRMEIKEKTDLKEVQNHLSNHYLGKGEIELLVDKKLAYVKTYVEDLQRKSSAMSVIGSSNPLRNSFSGMRTPSNLRLSRDEGTSQSSKAPNNSEVLNDVESLKGTSIWDLRESGKLIGTPNTTRPPVHPSNSTGDTSITHESPLRTPQFNRIILDDDVASLTTNAEKDGGRVTPFKPTRSQVHN